MGRNDSESVAATIDRAQEMPNDTGQGANVAIPDLFGGTNIPKGEEVINNLPHPRDPKRLQGIPSYNLEAHLRRFIVGTTYTETGDRGAPMDVVEHDDSAEYEALLNDTLTGRTILRWEEKSTLKDGTFVITVCYFTRKDQPTKRSTEPFEDVRS